MTVNQDSLSHSIVGAAIEVNRTLGPDLLESAHKECLGREFVLRGISFERQKQLPIIYKDVKLECGYRMDFLVGGSIVVELTAVEAITPVHEAIILTYLRLSGKKLGLLMNFNVAILEDGIRRFVL